MSAPNPELRPDPRTATADALIRWADHAAMVSFDPEVRRRQNVIVLIRLVRDLVKVRDELSVSSRESNR